jgi:hypothetical protein
MLGLGITIPKALNDQIDAEARLVSMCEREQSMAREIVSAAKYQHFLLQSRLEAHREEMRASPVLKQLLDYREGQPGSLHRLSIF